MSEVPPAKYDYEPKVPLDEYAVPREKIAALCKALFEQGFPRDIDGCGARIVHPDGRVSGVLIYLEGCPNIRRHERAHVNGWVHP